MIACKKKSCIESWQANPQYGFLQQYLDFN